MKRGNHGLISTKNEQYLPHQVGKRVYESFYWMTHSLHSLRDCLTTEARIHGPTVPLSPRITPPHEIMSLVEANHPLHKIQSLDQLQVYVESTQLTSIDHERTNAVFGEGNPNANIMLIGEAPGAEEDRQGRPFVGRAGQLLDKMMAAIDLSREELFIANILKSRPPENRDPLPEEIAAHLPVLYRQISFIQPKFILCLGRIAAQTLLSSDAPLGKLRGQPYPYHGMTLLATYHPAALLRNPSWKRPTWEDLKLLSRLYSEHLNPL